MSSHNDSGIRFYDNCESVAVISPSVRIAESLKQIKVIDLANSKHLSGKVSVSKFFLSKREQNDNIDTLGAWENPGARNHCSAMNNTSTATLWSSWLFGIISEVAKLRKPQKEGPFCSPLCKV